MVPARTKRNVLIAAAATVVILILAVVFQKVLSGPTTEAAAQSSSGSGQVAEKAHPVKSDWRLLLVDGDHTLPADYQVALLELENGYKVDERIYPELQQMFDAARDEGLSPTIVSAFRTTAEQQQIFDEKVAAFRAEGASASRAHDQAEQWVALPGTSEHQTGLAVDINATAMSDSDDKVYDWLSQNSYKYGFIQRYPSNKVDVTKVEYEPWHYRYVGKAAAAEIHESGLSLEEYLED